MPFWRAQALGDVLRRWTQVSEIMESLGPDEQGLADALLAAGQVGELLRKNTVAADGLELPDPPEDEAHAVTIEGEIWDRQDHVHVPCVVLRIVLAAGR
jgi:hypothetical protein